MRILLAIFSLAAAALAQPVCNVSNSQINGYVLTATSTGGHTCAWQAGGGGGGAVSSVFGRTGAVVAVSGDYTVSQITGAAPLASPAFTGSPTAPTQTGTDNSTKLATTAFVQALVGSGGCPTCLLGASPVNHGVAFGSATQAVNFSTAGGAGQPLLSGGAGANGAYGPLNLGGGGSIVIGTLPAPNLPVASSSGLGVVQGDGSTLSISGPGVISCTTMTTSQIGCAKVDGTTITISGGTLHANAGTLTGTGTLNHLAVWTGSNSLGDSAWTDNGSALITAEPVQITNAAFNALAVTGGITVGGTGIFSNSVRAPSYQVGVTTIIDTGLNIVNAVNATFSGQVNSNTLAVTGGGTFGGGMTAAGGITSTSWFNCGNPCTGYQMRGVNVIDTSSNFIGNAGTFSSSASNAVAVTGGITVGGTGIFSNSVRAPSYQVGVTTIIDTGLNIVNAVNGTFSGTVTGAGITSTGGINASGNITAIGGNVRAVTGGGFQIGSNTVIDASQNLALSGSVTLTGMGSSGTGSPVCITSGGLLFKGCSSGSVSAPLVLGSTSFTGNQAFQAIGAGAMDTSNDWSPNVGLLGPAATDTTTVTNHIIGQVVSALGMREGAVVGATITSSSDTSHETDGVIGMVVQNRANTNNAVAGSFMAASNVANGIVESLNTLVSDADTANNTCFGQYNNTCHYPSVLVGYELDINNFDTGSSVSGINLGITYLNGHPTALTRAVSFNVPGNSPANFFDYAMYSNDGAANVFAHIGRQRIQDPASQFVDFTSGSASQYNTRVWNDSVGEFVILAGQSTGNSNFVTVEPATGNLHLRGPSSPSGGIVQTDNSTGSALYAPYGQLYTGGSGTNTMIGSLSVGAVNSNSSIAGVRYLGQNTTQGSQDSLVLCQSSQINCFLDRDYPSGGANGGQINIGYNTPRALGAFDVVTIYDNSSDRNVLFRATSKGSSGGADAITMLPSGGTVTFSQILVNGAATFQSTINASGNISTLGSFFGFGETLSGSLSAAGVISTGGITATGGITSQTSFNCGLGCSSPYQIFGTAVFDTSRNLINTVNGNFSGVISANSGSFTSLSVGTMTLGGGSISASAGLFSGGGNAFTVTHGASVGTLAITGISGGSGGNHLCISGTTVYAGTTSGC